MCEGGNDGFCACPLCTRRVLVLDLLYSSTYCTRRVVLTQKIYSYPGNARVFKAQIAAAYNNVAVEVAADFEMGVTNKSAGFLAKFPLGKVPVMETPEGALYESDAIAYYVANAVANSTLLGSTPYEKALVQQYVSFGSLEVSANTGKWLYPLLGMGVGQE